MNVQALQTQQQTHKPFLVSPANMSEAIEYSKMIASSCFCPANMRNKPGDVLVAIQMGAEVGLSPIQALQNIAVINSRPCIWGDATVAVVQGHPRYVRHDEWTEGTIEKGDMVAFCSITRKGSEPHVRTFSIEDAKRANLWKKPGPWVQYPARMLQMRARAFAFRDKFSDALKGIQFREEVEDYAVIETRKPARVAATVVPANDALLYVFEGFMNDIGESRNELALKNVFDRIKAVNWVGTDYLQQLIDAKDRRKMDIKQMAAETVAPRDLSELSEPTEETSIADHAEFIAALSAEITE